MAEPNPEFRFTTVEASNSFLEDKRIDRSLRPDEEILKSSDYPLETLIVLSQNRPVETVAYWVAKYGKAEALRDIDVRMALTKANQLAMARTNTLLIAGEFGVENLAHRLSEPARLAAYQDFQNDLRTTDRTQALPTRWYTLTEHEVKMQHWDNVNHQLSLFIFGNPYARLLDQDPRFQAVLARYREARPNSHLVLA